MSKSYLVTLGAVAEEDTCTCNYANCPGSLLPCCHVVGVRKELGEV